MLNLKIKSQRNHMNYNDYLLHEGYKEMALPTFTFGMVGLLFQKRYNNLLSSFC
jgi:hypothetical protein